jgi:hypothetical protein
MMDAEKNLRELLKSKAEEVPHAPVIPDRVLRRSKIRRTISASLASALLIAASVGVLAGIRSIVEKPSIDPAHPAPRGVERNERTAEREGASQEQLVRCASEKSGGVRRDAEKRSRHEASTQVPLSLNLGPAEMLAIILGSSMTASESTCAATTKVEMSPPSGAKGGQPERGPGAGK